MLLVLPKQKLQIQKLQLNFKTDIPGYEFEYIPTTLASGGVGMYIDNMLEYKVLK